MQYFYKIRYSLISLMFLTSCNQNPNNDIKDSSNSSRNQIKDSVELSKNDQPYQSPISKEKTKEESNKVSNYDFVLDEENAIAFFFEYNKTLKETKVKLETNFGDITIELFNNVPYHKANFIYLTKKGYFNNTYFHRIVKGFIIQGGNADIPEVSQKRRAIGRYLLPPDTRKGHKHHRGVVSMPSSDIDNPHKLASPYEFFIVVTKPGSYHLDGGYTPFGQVIEGMDVVDQINAQKVDSGDWPMRNIVIKKAIAF